MSIDVSTLVQPKYIENSSTVQYTSSGVKTIFDKIIVHETTGANITLVINVVESGDTAGTDNQFFNGTILANETNNLPELAGLELDPGDFVEMVAGTASALTLRISGRISS